MPPLYVGCAQAHVSRRTIASPVGPLAQIALDIRLIALHASQMGAVGAVRIRWPRPVDRDARVRLGRRYRGWGKGVTPEIGFICHHSIPVVFRLVVYLTAKMMHSVGIKPLFHLTITIWQTATPACTAIPSTDGAAIERCSTALRADVIKHCTVLSSRF